MKKVQYIIALIVFASVFVIVGNHRSAFSNKTVRVGIYDNNPLVYQDSSGTPQGLTVDILNYVADKEGWIIDYKHGTWKECISWLNSGDTDLQVAIIPTPDRASTYNFSKEFVFTLWGQVYTTSPNSFESVLDLDGKKIAVYTNSVPAKKFNELIASFALDVELLNFSDYTEIATVVASGKADAGVFIRSFGEKYAEDFDLVKTPIIFNPLHLRYATLKNNDSRLLARLDHHLSILKESDNSYYYKAINHHFGARTNSPLPNWVKPVLFTISSLLCILFLVTWFQRLSVRKKDKTRKIAEERHSSFFHAMPIGVVYQNASGEIVMANKMAEHILGLTVDQMQGKTSMDPDWMAVDQNGDPLEGDQHPSMLALTTGQSITDTVIGVHTPHHDETRWLLVSSTPEFLEKQTSPFQVFTTFIDISDRVKSVNELKATKENLEELVNSRTIKLNDALKEFQSIFNNSLIGIMVLKKGRYFHKGNQRLADIFGYRNPAEMADISMKSLHLSEHSFTEFGKLYYDKLKDKELLHVEYELKRKDGGSIWCSLNGCAIESSSSDSLDHGVVWIIEDISERVKADLKLRDVTKKLEGAHQLSNSGWWEYDVVKDKLTWPEETYAIFGLPTNSPLTHDTLLNLIHPEYRDHYNGQLEKIFQDGEADWTYRITRPDGENKWIWAKGELELDAQNEPIKLFGTLQDITRQKKIEEELDTARKQAESANRAKSVFLSSMSHELRTPLNAILGYSQILSGNDNLTSLQHNGIETIHQAGNHLLHLINDVLDMSKIEAGKLELVKSPIYIEPFFSSVIDFFQIKAREKGIDFFVDIDAFSSHAVLIDELRLRQVMFNLLSNAIKFTPSGYCSVSVRTQTLPENRVKLTIIIEDSGIGIEPQLHETVFKPFQQVGDRLKRNEGSGLGLAISRKLIALMESSLTLESPIEPVKESNGAPGTRFSFALTPEIIEADQLPKNKQRGTVNGYIPSGGIDMPVRILVVDDIKSNRSVLVDILAPQGFNIKEAEDGNQVVSISLDYRPHLILMDLRMPGCDGFTALKHLRKHKELQFTPVVAVTASLTDDHIFEKRCLEHGFDAFLPKPFAVEQLIQIIENILPIDFIYQNSTSEKQDFSSVTQAPPAMADLKILKSLLAQGDVTGIMNKVDAISLENDQYTPFCDYLKDLADKLNITELEFLISSAIKEVEE